MFFPKIARARLLLLPVLTLVAFGLFSLRYQGAPESAPAHSPEALGYAITGAPKALYRWQSWARAHEAQGGDRRVVFALSNLKRSPALSGRVELDLLGGSVRAHLSGASADERLELWLVDDVAGTGNTGGVDPQDQRLRVGVLKPDATGTLSLEQALGPDAFAAFDADLVAISPLGAGAEGSIVSAQAGFFQKLYTGLRSGRIYRPDFDRAPGWGLPTAFAQRAPNAGRSPDVELEDLTIDADLVINELVARGADLFFNETFGGNGRTCGTCHPRENNLTIDAEFIGALPDNDPLFVAESVPALMGLDQPAVLRENAVVGIPEDGLDNPRVLRSVPHIFALATSIQRVPDAVAFDGIGDGGRPRPLERTGWGGDLGSADGGDGSLRNVANGAVATLFPKRLPGQAGTDFRLPTAAELDAIEAFYRALGRINDPMNSARVTFRNAAAQRGKDLFFRTDTQNGTLPAGKCSICHNNFGANADPAFFAPGDTQLQLQIGLTANANFDTGVEGDPTSVALRQDMGVPKDGGFGIRPLSSGCNEARVRGGQPPGGFGAIVQPGSMAIAVGLAQAGDCLSAFNTPPLIESLDTPPFFHNGILTDIEEVPMFYASDAFNNSDSGRFIASRDSGNRTDPNAVKAIVLDEDQVNDIGTTLRIVGGDENLAEAQDLIAGAQTTQARQNPEAIAPLLRQALEDLADFTVVTGGLQDDVDAIVAQVTELVQGAVDMDAGPEQDRALTQARQLIDRARAAFFVGPMRLYTADLPRVPPPRN